jgi:hypothetical protein
MLTQQRQNQLSQLPCCVCHVDVQVLEFESLGVRVCNTMRFFVLNPTSITYDFAWSPVLPPAAAALRGPPLASPFSCIVRKGTIAGGRCGCWYGDCAQRHNPPPMAAPYIATAQLIS